MAMFETLDPAAPPSIDVVARRASPQPVRRGGPAAAMPAARELDLEVTRLLGVRSGELAEPLRWQRPSFRREVEAVCADLVPIRSRLALLSSWQREARRDSAIRLAYAIVWLRLAHRRAGEYGPRTRNGTRSGPGPVAVRGPAPGSPRRATRRPPTPGW